MLEEFEKSLGFYIKDLGILCRKTRFFVLKDRVFYLETPGYFRVYASEFLFLSTIFSV